MQASIITNIKNGMHPLYIYIIFMVKNFTYTMNNEQFENSQSVKLEFVFFLLYIYNSIAIKSASNMNKV